MTLSILLTLGLTPGIVIESARSAASAAETVEAPSQAAVPPEAAAVRRPKFQMPFPCGAKRQGATYEGHAAGTHHALDFNRGSGNDDEGDRVVASAGGRANRTVRRSDGAKNLVIRHNSVWSTEYRHLSEFSVKDGATVKRGDEIGRVGRTGTKYAHLHYEQRKDGTPVAIHLDGKRLDPDYYFRDRDPTPSNGPTYVSRNC